MNTGPRQPPPRRRDYRARKRVRVSSAVARFLITAGGMGTIGAVCGVLLFLVAVVWAVFLPARVEPVQSLPAAGRASLQVGCDEYRVIAYDLSPDARLHLTSMRDGKPIGVQTLGEGELPRVTAVAAGRESSEGQASQQSGDRASSTTVSAVGFEDGTVRPWVLRFETTYYEPDAVEAKIRAARLGEVLAFGDGVIERTPVGQYRAQKTTSELGAPIPCGTDPIIAVHRGDSIDGTLLAALNATGGVTICVGEKGTDVLTGDVALSFGAPRALVLPARPMPPRWVAVTDLATTVHVIYEDGLDVRFAVSRSGDAKVVEQTDLVAAAGQRLTAVGVLLGDSTLIAADSGSKVCGWFTRNDPARDGGSILTKGHELELLPGRTATSIGTSSRERTFAVGTDRGDVQVFFMTSARQLATVPAADGVPITTVVFAPKNDGLLVGTAQKLQSYDYDPGHANVTLRALFGKVWYERHDEPVYVWQSTGGTDAFEPKLSMVPLVFGTLKATLYSMLFGAPLALLAALYTSEFLQRNTRNRVKPFVEMMASLPSVVLGFLAGSIVAPLVEGRMTVVLSTFITVPLALVLSAQLWRLLPVDRALRFERWRLFGVAVAIGGGVALALPVAALLERSLFGGALGPWLAGQVGSGFGAWLLLLLPCSVLVVALLAARFPPRRSGAQRLTAILQLGRFTLGSGAALGLAAVLAVGLHWGPTMLGFAPWDLRQGLMVGGFDLSPLGKPDQHNALVVGFMMGFAIIPIIYTIAEDALSAVPQHLRAASLGAGATPWQTAVRIVVPTAMSGMFSAMMVGLGRAVGETMIVLMAAGSTPVMDLNAFNGFRTLSANIATELPEAAPGGTHYRTLFLAALVLFAMTFVINTIAEAVRLRFRRRAYQL